MQKPKDIQFKKFSGGDYVRGPIRISHVAWSEIVQFNPKIKPYQQVSFYLPKEVGTFIRAGYFLYIPEEVL